MSAKSLAVLVQTMAANPAKIRWLNISYNSVGKIEEPPLVSKIEDPKKKPPKKNAAPETEKTGPELFMDAMKSFLTETSCLNHLDISGMSLERKQVLELCQTMA